jgi:hypothetical protein
MIAIVEVPPVAARRTAIGVAAATAMTDAVRQDETTSAVVVGRRDVMIEVALIGAMETAAARTPFLISSD